MGSDGAKGLKRFKDSGAKTIAQMKIVVLFLECLKKLSN